MEDLDKGEAADVVEMSSSDEDETESIEQKICHSDAIKAFNVAVEWSVQNSINMRDIITVKAIQEKAVMAKIAQKNVQKRITDFFTS